MINAFYTVSNSMITQQKVVDSIAGNMANVNTTGYKKVDASFKDMLYSIYEGEGDESFQLGNGVSLKSYEKDFSDGVLVKTGNELDIAVEGNGFLKVGNNNGDTFYSRGGSFTISNENTRAYIVDSNGLYLLDQYGAKIEVGVEAGEMGIDTDGLMVFSNNDNTYNLKIVTFKSPGNLNIYGSNLYTYNEAAGEESETEKGKVMQSYVENSNVDLAIEMTDLIKVQRLYEMNSKMVQVIDEIQGLANRLRG